jgi:hypothetical protein
MTGTSQPAKRQAAHSGSVAPAGSPSSRQCCWRQELEHERPGASAELLSGVLIDVYRLVWVSRQAPGLLCCAAKLGRVMAGLHACRAAALGCLLIDRPGSASHTMRVQGVGCVGAPVAVPTGRAPQRCSARAGSLRWPDAPGRRAVPWQRRSVLLQASQRRPRRACCQRVIRAMFERFTEPAIKAMMLSQSEAKAAGALEVSAGWGFLNAAQLLTAPVPLTALAPAAARSPAARAPETLNGPAPAQVKLEHLLLGLCQADKRLLSSSKLDLEKGRRMLRAQRATGHAVRAAARAPAPAAPAVASPARAQACFPQLLQPHGARRRRTRRSARPQRQCRRPRRRSRGSWG